MRDEEHVVYCHVITLQLIVFRRVLFNRPTESTPSRRDARVQHEASSEHFLLNATNNCLYSCLTFLRSENQSSVIFNGVRLMSGEHKDSGGVLIANCKNHVCGRPNEIKILKFDPEGSGRYDAQDKH
jgi:hypothetical protein